MQTSFLCPGTVLYWLQQEERQGCNTSAAQESYGIPQLEQQTAPHFPAGLRCMRFPTRADGSIDEPRAEALLNTAKAAGVNYFDTAYPYHNGQSEPFVGRVIAKWERSSFYLPPRCRCGPARALPMPSASLKSSSSGWGWNTSTFTCCTRCTKPGTSRAKELGIVDWLWEQKAAGRIRNSAFPATTTPPVLRPSCGISLGFLPAAVQLSGPGRPRRRDQW